MKKALAIAFWACLLWGASAVPTSATGRTSVLLAPAKTRVGMARVNLEVHGLRLADADTLVGTYEIRIPMAPWKNDRGEISLDAPGALEALTADGGTLSGKGHSELDGRIHGIICEFSSGGTVRIRVSTPDRDLDFLTRFELVESDVARRSH